jgi:toxin ParE1/3/4
MNRYKISQLAEQDLEDIWVYLAENNQIAADKQIANILNRLPMLAQFSDMGQVRDDLGEKLRSFPVKPYIANGTHLCCSPSGEQPEFLHYSTKARLKQEIVDIVKLSNSTIL